MSSGRSTNAPPLLSIRALGWLAVALLVATALLGGAPRMALANDLHQDPPIRWDAAGFGDDDCGTLEAGQVLWHFIQNQVDDDVTAAKLTAEFATAGVITADAAKITPGGVIHWNIVTGHDTLLDASSDVTSDGQLNLSHICVGPEESEAPSTAPSEAPSTAPSEAPSTAPSELPSEAPSELPSEAPSELPSEAPSTAPSESPSEVPSETPSTVPTESVSTSPSGGVEGVTGTPRITPPATDVVAATSSPSTDGWRLVILAMAGLLAAVLLLTPSPRRLAGTQPIRTPRGGRRWS